MTYARNESATAAGTARGAEQTNRVGLHAHGNPYQVVLHALEMATGKAPIRSGNGSRSRCASCGGRTEKVAVSEAANGAVLLHAFCGCAPAEVLAACGLTLADLFPRRLDAMTPTDQREARRRARESGWGAALSMLPLEIHVVRFAALQLSDATPLAAEDCDRLALACVRIEGAAATLTEAPTWKPDSAYTPARLAEIKRQTASELRRQAEAAERDAKAAQDALQVPA